VEQGLRLHDGDLIYFSNPFQIVIFPSTIKIARSLRRLLSNRPTWVAEFLLCASYSLKFPWNVTQMKSDDDEAANILQVMETLHRSSGTKTKE
jgi:hypothetical protein